MLSEFFVYPAAFLSLVGLSVYAHHTRRGRIRPNRVTWSLWTVIPLIAFFAQLDEGVGVVALFSLAYAVGPLLVLIASFMHTGAYWKLTTFDILCGVISVFAIIAWVLTRDPLIAIILSICADCIAGLPTLVKAYRVPTSEHVSAYLVGMLSALLTLATLHTWSLAAGLFPLYIFINSALIFVALTTRSPYRPVRRTK